MDITFLCGNCHQPLSIDEGGAGMTIDCPNCAKPVYVPSQPSGAAAPVAPATTTPAPVKRLAFAAATPAGTRAATTTMPAPAPATTAKPSAGNASRPQKDPKKKYLERIRRQSAYPELRTIVLILTIMGYIIAAGSFLVGVVLATGFAQMIRGGGILMFMAGTVNAALTMTGTLVFRSFALMWIDLVDSVIDRNARDKEY